MIIACLVFGGVLACQLGFFKKGKMKIFTAFCVILFVWGSTADSISDLSEIEKLVSNEIGHENYAREC